MSTPTSGPSDSDRQFLQQELTQLVGQGKLSLDAFQDLVDLIWSTDSNNDLMQIRMRFLSQHQTPPPAPRQQSFAVANPTSFHQSPDIIPTKSTMGSIKKNGVWAVPEYSSYKLNGSDLHLDLRQATTQSPVVTFDVSMSMSTMIIVVPPGVFVDVQMASKNFSEFKIESSQPIPNAPRVVLRGVSRASTLKVIVRQPHESLGFWESIFGE